MIAADRAIQRPADARLLVVGADGSIVDTKRAHWLDFLKRGDLIVANDAATLPASLAAVHVRTQRVVEVRLAAWRARGALAYAEFDAVVFGAGDFRTRTEDRALPPPLPAGDVLACGALLATVQAVLGHPRLVRVRFAVPLARFWRVLADRGRPIQYAHVPAPLSMRDTWTSIAATPAAFEPPSAGFVIDWRDVALMAARGIAFATLTHAAGLSSTGDPRLDARLPLDEWYRIPATTARAIAGTLRARGRVIAVGTTVVRALEHATTKGVVEDGEGVATQRIGASTRLAVVEALVTGTHEPGSSRHELLRAFASDTVLARAAKALDRGRYRTHEFGDSLLVFRGARGAAAPRRACASACA